MECRGITRFCTQDVIYDGFLIPKGSYIIPNIWQILHNENTCPDPEAFRPDRFLGENPQADPRSASFGYGRRICPGLHLADAAVFMAIAMSLAVFDVSRVVENGVEVIPELDPTEGIVGHRLSDERFRR
ncbi:cytochrome P450 [Phlebopus sp. FC_14]|nr:cytochrome P450 [Phlebopus sp. FC_14]